jgi:preprotein translocase subunit SecA
MHVQVQVAQPEGPAPAEGGTTTLGGDEGPAVRDVSYSAPEGETAGAMSTARAGAAIGGSVGGPVGGPNPARSAPMQPLVKSEWDKTPRNAPCPCGSGKKFKLCHGR